MTTSDGRLDLDELGRVIDGADTLDDAYDNVPDVLEGAQGLTLRERLDDAGVTPWLRRHRAALASVAVVGVAVGALAWVRHDPRPPDDGLAHVGIAEGVTDGQFGQLVGVAPGVVTATYTLVNQRPGDDVAIVGFTGPGIRASSAARVDSPTKDDARADFAVTAVLGCQDPKAIGASEDEFRLLVRRTDSYGRTVQTAEPLPSSPQARWDFQVGSECLRQSTLEWLTLDGVGVSADPRALTLSVVLKVTNRMGVDVDLSVQSYPGGSVRPEPMTAALPTGRSTSFTVVERIQDCGGPVLDWVVRPENEQFGYSENDRGVSVQLLASGINPNAALAQRAFTWSNAVRDRVHSLLAGMCATRPWYRTRVVSSSLAPYQVQQDAVSAMGGDTGTKVLRTVLDVTTTADHVATRPVELPEDFGNGGVVTISVDDATVSSTGGKGGVSAGSGAGSPGAVGPSVGHVAAAAGHAVVVVDWTMSCSSVFAPATVRLLLTRKGQTWPQFISLADPVVAKAVLRVCPQVSSIDLLNNGWPEGSVSALG
jgi:hypothetical protein